MRLPFLPDCEEAAHRSWLLLRHVPQTSQRKFGLKMHLLVCRRCSDYSRNLNWVSETLSDIEDAPTFDAAYKIRPDVREKIREAVESRIGKGTSSEA